MEIHKENNQEPLTQLSIPHISTDSHLTITNRQFTATKGRKHFSKRRKKKLKGRFTIAKIRFLKFKDRNCRLQILYLTRKYCRFLHLTDCKPDGFYNDRKFYGFQMSRFSQNGNRGLGKEDLLREAVVNGFYKSHFRFIHLATEVFVRCCGFAYLHAEDE